jgi:hypothetical protein
MYACGPANQPTRHPNRRSAVVIAVAAFSMPAFMGGRIRSLFI